MNAKLIIPVCIGLSLSIPGLSFGQQFLNYKNYSVGIQIDYPNGWMYTEGKQPLPPSVFSPSNLINQRPLKISIFLWRLCVIT